jgi:hypothetical protein
MRCEWANVKSEYEKAPLEFQECVNETRKRRQKDSHNENRGSEYEKEM